jgi:hypothetical protein
MLFGDLFIQDGTSGVQVYINGFPTCTSNSNWALWAGLCPHRYFRNLLHFSLWELVIVFISKELVTAGLELCPDTDLGFLASSS